MIHTWPNDVRKDEGPSSYCDWDKWEHDGEWPAFTSAIDRIIELDHLNALEIHFTDMCRGEESHWNEYGGTADDREMPGERKAALEAVYKAVKQREARRLQGNGARISPIRELKVNRLQNIQPPDVLVNGLLRGVERFDLNFAAERNDFLNWEDFQLPERLKFDGILRNTILAPIADQPVELSIGAQYEWGLLPARFEGKGLKFPKLRKLKLDFYPIGHYDHMDWVLDQKSLTSLHLEDCQIVTHLHFNGEEEEWGISTDDWRHSNKDPWLQNAASEYYTFDLRWNTIFDKIRVGLPRLTGFRASWPVYCGTKEGFSRRYIHFTTNDFPVPFAQVVIPEWMKACKNGPLDVAHAAYEMDVAALNALRETVYERWKRQSI